MADISGSPPAPENGAPVDAIKAQRRNFEQFNKLAGGIQSLIAAAGIIVGGGWALIRFDTLLEQRIAAAQAEKLEADAIASKRVATGSKIVNIDISTNVLPATTSGERWVQVELSLKNTGNEPIKLDLSKKTRFYVSKVLDIGNTGFPTYEDHRKNLQFDFPDKTIEWFMLRPGAEIDRYRTIQRLNEPGLYIARFSLSVPDSSIGEGWEYSAQTFFVVQ
jgi:hypothetical protein